jgi:hypothetical protein
MVRNSEANPIEFESTASFIPVLLSPFRRLANVFFMKICRSNVVEWRLFYCAANR